MLPLFNQKGKTVWREEKSELKAELCEIRQAWTEVYLVPSANMDTAYNDIPFFNFSKKVWGKKD